MHAPLNRRSLVASPIDAAVSGRPVGRAAAWLARLVRVTLGVTALIVLLALLNGLVAGTGGETPESSTSAAAHVGLTDRPAQIPYEIDLRDARPPKTHQPLSAVEPPPPWPEDLVTDRFGVPRYVGSTVLLLGPDPCLTVGVPGHVRPPPSDVGAGAH